MTVFEPTFEPTPDIVTELRKVSVNLLGIIAPQADVALFNQYRFRYTASQ
ncbi:hypothetical protein H4P12_08685 [Paracoccus sp. 11-3]|uniref:Uncharacterized protein n=1 Tax=Paracoccus amoyensis TaxID=2760093 RepID=A0A926J609_9RHOB|nr:hypothetical protein [Paracoccus amoyensis]MBC9246787.1 hypothetical protein [Paracoccus amoyensis]